MKRIYKNNDLVFNLSINSFMLNLDLINSIEFKFYTLNNNNYIKKTKEDINEDNQIILQWNELDNLEEGVLFYDYHISISNITMTDGTEDTVTKVMTNYYICNGNSSIDINNDFDYTQYYTKEEIDTIVDNIVIGDIDLSDYYNKTEVDNLINGIEIPDTDLSDYYTKSEVDVMVDNVDVDLSNYYTKTQTYSKSEVNELIDGVTAGDVDLTGYYTKTETDTKLSGYSTTAHTHSEYLTEHQDLSSYALKSDIPTDYLTEIPSEYVTETELNSKGYLTEHQPLKTINGESIIGEGNIVITGGEGGTSGVQSIGVGENPSVWDTFYDSVKFYTSWIDLDDDNNPETLDVRVSGNLQDGTADATTLWFGFTSSDNSIKLNNYSSRLDLQLNTNNLKTINGNSIVGEGDITIIGGDADLSNYYNKTEIDTKLNDYSSTAHTHSEYLTEHQDLSSYALKSDIPTDYLTSIPEEYVTETELTDVLSDYTKDSEFKTINGESIIGEGNIVITGGSSEGTAGVEYISTSYEPSEWDTFKGGVKLTTGFTTYDEGDTGLDIFINGNLSDGSEAGSLWFGFRSTDKSITLTDGGGRIDLQLNTNNLKTINGNSIIGTGDITISGGDVDLSNYYTKSETYTKEEVNALVNNEWIGTQAEYNALGEYDSNITYNIIEG